MQVAGGGHGQPPGSEALLLEIESSDRVTFAIGWLLKPPLKKRARVRKQCSKILGLSGVSMVSPIVWVSMLKLTGCYVVNCS